MESYVEKIKELELVELQQGEDVNENVYKYLLIYYLLENKMMMAKFLWKRVPSAMRLDESSELNRLWKICQNIIIRKYSVAFEFANRYANQWSTDEISSLVSKLIENTKEILFDLINNAYSSISVVDLSSLFCLSVDQVTQMALSRDWVLDDTKAFLLPTKKVVDVPSNSDVATDEQMQQLTSLVSYLEN